VEGRSTGGQNTFTFEFPGPVSEVGLFVSDLKEDDLTTRGTSQDGAVDTALRGARPSDLNIVLTHHVCLTDQPARSKLAHCWLRTGQR